MDEEVLELITQKLTDMRLNEIIHKNVTYIQALQDEIDLYEQFVRNLSEWQKEGFEKYWVASSESALIREKLSYQQGMKDLMAFLQSIK